MRVYLAATTGLLRGLLESGVLEADADHPRTGFAVTPAVRAHYIDDDDEELEYAAMRHAARGSLRLIDSDPSADRRRVVVAAEVPESAVTVRDDLEQGAVRVDAAVPMSAVAAVHVDDADAELTVAAAAAVMIEADLGDPAAQERVDDAEGYELSWYANQEIGALLELG